MGILPFLPNQHIARQAGPGHGSTQEQQPALVGMAEGNFSGSQSYLQSFPNLTAGGLLTGHHKQQQSQPKGLEISSGVRKLWVGVCVCERERERERERVCVHACIHIHINAHMYIQEVCICILHVCVYYQGICIYSFLIVS